MSLCKWLLSKASSKHSQDLVAFRVLWYRQLHLLPSCSGFLCNVTLSSLHASPLSAPPDVTSGVFFSYCFVLHLSQNSFLSLLRFTLLQTSSYICSSSEEPRGKGARQGSQKKKTNTRRSLFCMHSKRSLAFRRVFYVFARRRAQRK